MDESDLWARARAGEEAARGRLCEHARDVAARALARRGERGERLADLVQESVRSTLAFLAANTEAPRDLEAFLKYRAWGILSDHRKAMRAQRVEYRDSTVTDPSDPGSGPEHGSLTAELARVLAECRARLDEPLEHVLALRYDAGRETEAIARELGIHRNTVAVRVFRAFELLRECLRRRGFAPEDAA